MEIETQKVACISTVTTKGYFIADMQMTQGSCTNGEGDTFLYDLDQGQAVDGIDTTIESDSCQATIEPDTSDNMWTLIIVPTDWWALSVRHHGWFNGFNYCTLPFPPFEEFGIVMVVRSIINCAAEHIEHTSINMHSHMTA